ncbi:MAG: ATP-grasp domain-containing protein [Methylophilus sp.]|nr:ATP-grasp domain-containing protein [Methylophilus sp.]
MHNPLPLKLFVCEFITGGGLMGEEIPTSLAREGLLMRDALLGDLSTVSNLALSTTFDKRFSPFQHHAVQSIQIDEETDVWLLWESLIDQVDAVWWVAPETNDILYRLTQLAVLKNKLVIGSGLDAIAITSKKDLTAQTLSQSGIPTIPTSSYQSWQDSQHCRWLVKPNDGVGCEDTYLFELPEQVHQWFESNPEKQLSHVIQPWIEGVAASMSVLAYANSLQVLSCNEQLIVFKTEGTKKKLSYVGSHLNNMMAYRQACIDLALQIQQSIPGLQGYYGVDVVIHPENLQCMTVVEINPRLTTSYVRLKEAMNTNPAQLILSALTQKNFAMPKLEYLKVAFYV